MPKKVNKPNPKNLNEINIKNDNEIIKRKRRKKINTETEEPHIKPQIIDENNTRKLKKQEDKETTNIKRPKGQKNHISNITTKLNNTSNISTNIKPPFNKDSYNITDYEVHTEQINTNSNNLPNEKDFIDTEIKDYLNKAINHLENNWSLFRSDRLHSLNSILYIINNPIDISLDEMYKNMHNNVVQIKSHIDSIVYDSKQDLVDFAVNEIFNLILNSSLSIEQSNIITEHTENW